jgi:hypothetical protein
VVPPLGGKKERTAVGVPHNEGRPWSQLNDAELIRLILQNTPTRVIGLKVGRSETAISTRADSPS